MIRVIITLLLVPFLLIGATSPTQWDVRPTGSNSNSGGFDPTVTVPGTDYSQQNGVQYTFTDILILTPATTFSSILNPVVAGMVGNVVRVTGGSGCTSSYYTIISQAAGVATVDATLGTIASTCTGVLGGSFLTIAQADTAADSQTNDNAQGVTWLKTSTYTLTVPLACKTAPWRSYVGYGTTHGDNGTRPLVTTATNSTILCDFANTGTNGGITWQNVNFSNTAGTRAAAFNSSGPRAGLQLINCILDGFSTAITSTSIGSGGYSSVILDSVEIKNSVGTSMEIGVFDVITDVFRMSNSKVHDNGGAGLTLTRIMNVALERNTIYNNSGAAILISAGASLKSFYMDSNTIANNSGSGVDGSGGTSFVNPTTNALVAVLIHRNNVYYGQGAWAINMVAGAVQQTPISSNYNNAYGSNSSGNLNHFTAGTNDKTLTANPFTSSTDFTPNNTAGGGAVLKAAAGGLTVGALDIGAVQSSGATTQHSYSTAQ